MKKRLSIWMLCAGSTMNHLLALLALMAAGSTGLFYLACRKNEGDRIGLEQIFKNSGIAWLFLVIFLLWTAVLMRPDQNKATFTLNRLQVSPEKMLVTYSCYNALSYVVLWGAQVLLLAALFHWYGTAVAQPEDYGPQTMLLTFYRNNTLHSLLPLEDWTRYLRNLALVIGMGTAAAWAGRGLKRSLGYLAALLVLCAGVAMWFPAEIGNWTNDLLLGVGPLLYAGGMIAMVRPGLKGEDGNEKT